MVAHSCNPSMWQAESGRSCPPGQPELQRGLHMSKQIHYKIRKDTWLYISDCSQSEAGTNTRIFFSTSKAKEKSEESNNWKSIQFKKLDWDQGTVAHTLHSFQRSGGRGRWSTVGSKPAWYVHGMSSSLKNKTKPFWLQKGFSFCIRALSIL